jgi:phosphoglycerol transferase MdoB-like AlkP superfamily enzyme
VLSSLASRLPSLQTIGWRGVLGMALLAALHLVALERLLASEEGYTARLFFLGAWVMLNFFWLSLLRRPAVSAALSLAMIVTLMALSRFKSENLWMTVSFVDVMVIDVETVSFLFAQSPDLRYHLAILAAIAIPALVLLWWLDPFRIRRRVAVLGFAACFAGLTGLALLVPEEPWEAFLNNNYVSKFVRSGITAARELMTRGVFEAEAMALPADRLSPPAESCQPAGRQPHIIMLLDESSFDIRAAPGIKVPSDYGPHFRSFDGKQRSFLVEGSGGPTWYTEYNVLSGLSSRSFGRFAYFLTRIAAGNVQRGLPQALRRCGYKTITNYPAFSAFLSARKFQTGLGIELFRDGADMRIDHSSATDKEYYDEALRTIARERGARPLFLFVYLTANHFWWDTPFRPDRTPNWQPPGNDPDADEYIRRQMMSVADYQEFLAGLRRDFPDEPFLIVRFGDHQPNIAPKLINPKADDTTIARQIMGYDQRYLTTYYAIDAINHEPVDLSSALDVLDAPYLPLVVLEAAGLPLDPSFAEQKKIMQRCNGLFYACRDGAETRRFNRLLIDAGLIKGF